MGTLIALLLIGLAGLVATVLAIAVVGSAITIALAITGFLLFKVAPIVLIGWLIVRFLAPRRRRITAADRAWLESD